MKPIILIEPRLLGEALAQCPSIERMGEAIRVLHYANHAAFCARYPAWPNFRDKGTGQMPGMFSKVARVTTGRTFTPEALADRLRAFLENGGDFLPPWAACVIEAAVSKIKEDAMKAEQPPASGDFRDGARAEGFWFENYNGILARYEQVAGSSGVYLIVTAVDTGEVLRDGRPWQMMV